MSEKGYFSRLLYVAIMYFICFFLTMGVVYGLTEFVNFEAHVNSFLWIAVVQSVVGFIFPSFLATSCFTQEPLQFLCLDKPPTWKALLGVLLIYIVSIPALNQLVYWNANFEFLDGLNFGEMSLKEMEEKANDTSEKMLNVASIGGLIANLLVIGLITAFGEELFFRGTLQRAVATNGRPHLAIWIVAIVFSAMHLQAYGFVPRVVLGAWFGYLLFWTGSLYVPVFAHFLNNAFVVLFAWLEVKYEHLDATDFGTVESGFPWLPLISACAVAVFLVCFRKFFFISRTRLTDE